MKHRFLQYVGATILLASALATGWVVTDQLRDSRVVGGTYASCFSDTVSSEQIRCVSDRFIAGAERAASDANSSERGRTVSEFVRRQEREAAADTRLAGVCHPAMHELGRREGARAAAADVPPVFPDASSQLCTAGYVHGLSEGYLVGTPAADVAAVFPSLCHDADAREGCAHGVGHALLRARVDDRPVTAAAAAVDRCGELPADYPTNCTNGVYMELAMRMDPVSVQPEAFVEACRRAGSVEARLSCWSYLGLNLSTNDVELSAVPDWCARANLPGQFQCIEDFGRDAGIRQVAMCGDVDAMVELRKRCIEGAVALQVGSGHVEKAAAREHCSALASRELVRHCEGAVERYSRGRKIVEGD